MALRKLFLSLPNEYASSLFVVSAADLRAFEASVGDIVDNADAFAAWFHKSAAPQGAFFRPGTLAAGNRLLVKLARLEEVYPSITRAREIYRSLRPLPYAFAVNGKTWRIEADAPARFRAPFCPGPWFITTAAGLRLETDGRDISEALELLPLLNGYLTETDVRTAIRDSKPKHRLFEGLLKTGAICEVTSNQRHLRDWPHVLFLGHSSLFLRTGKAAIISDPAFSDAGWGVDDPRLFQLLDLADAVLITHHHWDHCNPSTLLRIDRGKRIYVPACSKPSFANVPLRPYLAYLGFRNVVEVRPWQRVKLKDLEIRFTPSRGEPFGLNSAFDCFGFVAKLNGRTLFSSGDASRDERGSMDPIMRQIAREKIDVFSFGSSGKHWPVPVAAGMFRVFSNELLFAPEFIRVHPTSAEATRWSRILKPKLLVPIAQFIFKRAPGAPIEVSTEERGLDTRYRRYRDGVLRALGNDPDLAVWLAELDHLRIHATGNLIGLHPMQGFRVGKSAGLRARAAS